MPLARHSRAHRKRSWRSIPRSPDRPNPIGVHRVTVIGFEGPTTFRVGALEAIDGTPIVDLKIVMDESRDD